MRFGATSEELGKIRHADGVFSHANGKGFVERHPGVYDDALPIRDAKRNVKGAGCMRSAPRSRQSVLKRHSHGQRAWYRLGKRNKRSP